VIFGFYTSKSRKGFVLNAIKEVNGEARPFVVGIINDEASADFIVRTCNKCFRLFEALEHAQNLLRNAGIQSNVVDKALKEAQ